jgi:hypothetical protein
MGGDEENNNVTYKEWTRPWIYSTTFDTPLDDSGVSWKIILEGLKMGAAIVVNGVTVGTGSSMSSIILLIIVLGNETFSCSLCLLLLGLLIYSN